jgi:hypothetical protein
MGARSFVACLTIHPLNIRAFRDAATFGQKPDEKAADLLAFVYAAGTGFESLQTVFCTAQKSP